MMTVRLRQGYQIISGWVVRHKLWAFLFSFVAMLFFFAICFIQLISWGAFGPIPDEEALTHLNIPLASEIYTADSLLIGRYFKEDRRWVASEDISPHVVHALIATEDERFFEHDGVDERSLFRVLFKNLLLGDKSQGGGSTIHQQLAKNLFPRQKYRFMGLLINKIKESIIAQDLDGLYDKEEILNLYLNTVAFGENAFGIETAAQRFFNIPARELGPEQAALLIGMLKGTNRYNPRIAAEASQKEAKFCIGSDG